MASPNDPFSSPQVVALLTQILEEQKKQTVTLQRIQQAMADLGTNAGEVAVSLKKISKIPSEPRPDYSLKVRGRA